jgi:DNA-binding transcriptional LysR family regulator
MLDGLSLDQIRTFIAAADAGSFSAAGRRLGRAQSAVSQTLANLETQLRVRLFECQGRYPVLTAEGKALLADARAVAGDIDLFKARARGLAGGLEPELSIAVDAMFPTRVLTCAVIPFQAEFPNTPLRVSVDGLGAVIEPVLNNRCAFAIGGSLPIPQPELTNERLFAIGYQMMAAPQHPFAAHRGPIPASALAQHVQLVLSDRSRFTEGREFGVLSPKTWRVSDLGAKHMFLLAALGWGGMPLHMVEDDLGNGRLVALTLEDTESSRMMTMSASYRTDAPPGPAGRWLIERLKQRAAEARHETLANITGSNSNSVEGSGTLAACSGVRRKASHWSPARQTG